MFSPENESLWSLYKILYTNVGDLGKIIVATGFENLPNLVALIGTFWKTSWDFLRKTIIVW